MTDNPQRQYRRNGFTLLEILVCISVIVILISLMLPSLVTSREKAQEIVCLSKTGQLAGLVTACTNDFDSLFPNVAGDPRAIAADTDRWYSFVVQSRYMFWKPEWLEWSDVPKLNDLYHCVANPHDQTDENNNARGPNFGIVSSAYTAPGYFDRAVPDSAWEGRFPGKLRAMHDVTFASEKVMVYEADIYHGWKPPHTGGDGHTLGIYGTNGRGATAQMDGSGRLIGSDEPSAFMVRRDYAQWSGGRFDAPEFGIAGRDFQPGGKLN